MTTLLDNSQTGVHRTPFKLGTSVDTTVFWPNGGYVQGDTALLFFSRFANSSLAHLGNYVCKYVVSTSFILPLQQLPVNDIIYLGNAVLYDSTSNYLYLYGSKLNWIVFEPYVVRVQANNLLGTWEYFAGNGNWSANPSMANPINNNNLNVSAGFSVFQRSGKYYLITQENGYLTCGLGLKLYSQFSTQPYGPFANTTLLYTIDDTYEGDTLVTYNATAHPEFIQNNELLLSYNVNGTIFDTTAPHLCPSPCVNPFTDRMPANLYRPRFVRVPLELMDPELGVEEVQQPAIEASPNPFQRRLTLRLLEAAGQWIDLKICNVMGQVLVRQTIQADHEGKVVIDGTALPNGLLWVQLEGDRLRVVEKVLKVE